MPRNKIRVVPLGGLGEIGKNMTVIEYKDDIIVIDAGVMFPEEEMLGIDLVIPDISYLLERRERVRGIVITHGHEDHTGALPYILPHLNVPIYCTRLTHGLISVKLKEHKLLRETKLNIVQPGDRVTLGRLVVEFIHVNHSIPDAVALAIHTPIGTVVHSGDFKIDHTPVDGKRADLARLAQLGTEGVLLLFSDSTYVERPGYTPSEQVVGEALDQIMSKAPGRVIVTTFASLISRVQQVIDSSSKNNRKVFVVGRSMVENVRMAQELGYLSAPPGVLSNMDKLRQLPPEQITLITTGSQGEPTSALTRIANKDNPNIRIAPGDTVVMSATAIPGNERLIYRTIDSLFKQGAQVIYPRIAQVHVHGHASQEELKLMISLVRPKFFIPVHGEYRHLVLHGQLAQSLGMSPENVFILEDGDVIDITTHSGRLVTRIPADSVYVDGLGVGDVGTIVLRDRRLLSQDGIMVVILAFDKRTGKIVGQPDLVSRGFVDNRDSQFLLDEAREVVIKAIDHGGDRLAESGFINTKIKDSLAKFLYEQTKRRPMILPVTMEV